jgi:exodeoxyribonuclease-5
MLQNYLKNKILKNIEYQPTNDQMNLIDLLSEFIVDQKNNMVLISKGYAGTGKTITLSALVKTLYEFNINFILMAPTGRAAKVLSAYSGFKAYTIHKIIYRQKSSKDGFGRFVLDTNFSKNTIFIVDEASLISNISSADSFFGSGNLLDDLIEYVYSGKNCKLILTGDIAQLPPVGTPISAALDENILSKYNLDVIKTELKEVVRQSQQSGILMNATYIRNNIIKGKEQIPIIKVSNYSDMFSITGNELVDCLEEAYSKYGYENVIVICRSNKRANLINNGIRRRLLSREEELSAGDLIMVVKNNYFWANDKNDNSFIANGEIAVVDKIYNFEEQYNFKFANILISFPDFDNLQIKAKVMLNTLTSENASLALSEHKELFNTILNEIIENNENKNKKKLVNDVRNNEYFNALQIKYAYAITCHKSQGGQWKSVFIDAGYLINENINSEFLRWLYTAFTRATEELYLINFNQSYIA